MARDHGDFSDEQLQRRIARIRRPSFYGELTMKSVGGKITDVELRKTEKPDSPEE